MTITALPEHEGLRIDVLLAAQGGFSRSFASKLLSEGHVCIRRGGSQPSAFGDSIPVKKNHIVKDGESFEVFLPELQACETLPEDIRLDVVYEDNDLIVVNKERGMVVHPAPGHSGGTLVNALLAHCGGSLSGIGGVQRPGIVHRLDKDTSGLLVVAKNDAVHLALSSALKERSVSRVYEAVVRGHPRAAAFTVDEPVGRHPIDRKKMAVTQNGRPAVTHIEVLREYPGYSHVRCKLETGRTHQIRVHMAHSGHPLLGDELYGSGPNNLGIRGQCLHARLLSFLHPKTGEQLNLSTDIPEYFKSVLDKLDKLL